MTRFIIVMSVVFSHVLLAEPMFEVHLISHDTFLESVEIEKRLLLLSPVWKSLVDHEREDKSDRRFLVDKDHVFVSSLKELRKLLVLEDWADSDSLLVEAESRVFKYLKRTIRKDPTLDKLRQSLILIDFFALEQTQAIVRDYLTYVLQSVSEVVLKAFLEAIPEYYLEFPKTFLIPLSYNKLVDADRESGYLLVDCLDRVLVLNPLTGFVHKSFKSNSMTKPRFIRLKGKLKILFSNYSLWDVGAGKWEVRGKSDAHARDGVTWATYIGDSLKIFIAGEIQGRKSSIHMLDAAKGSLDKSLEIPLGSFCEPVSVQHEEKVYVVCTHNSNVVVWNVTDDSSQIYDKHSEFVHCMSMIYNSGHPRMITGGHTGKVHIWDPISLETESILEVEGIVCKIKPFIRDDEMLLALIACGKEQRHLDIVSLDGKLLYQKVDVDDLSNLALVGFEGEQQIVFKEQYRGYIGSYRMDFSKVYSLIGIPGPAHQKACKHSISSRYV